MAHTHVPDTSELSGQIDFGGIPLAQLAEDIRDLSPVYLGEMAVTAGDEDNQGGDNGIDE